MLSQVRRGHHQEFDGSSTAKRPVTHHDEQWKYAERGNSSPMHNYIPPNAHPVRSSSTILNPDLSRAFRVDAQLLAIIRIEDKRSTHYSSEVVTKLRQKEQTQSFINKPCSLYVADRFLVIVDRLTQVTAETIPLENLDPTCVQSDTPDTLNDIFMYRSFERYSGTGTHRSHSINNDSSPVVVFKCSNKESKVLVDCIRNGTGKQLRPPRSARSQTRSHIDQSVTDTGQISFYDPQASRNDAPPLTSPTHATNSHHPRATNQPPASTPHTADYYKHLTEDLNKCFDDIELFVRHLEISTNYTKSIERDHRSKKERKAAASKQTFDKLPDDRYFVDVLQKFKYSFNLIGELKHVIRNPNGPELVHYLLTPLQLILYTLRQKHPNQPQLAQDIWTPPLIKEARELLLNCLTSREHDTLRSLGPAWIRTAEETPQKVSDFKPVFFEGRPVWEQDSPNDHPLPSARGAEKGPSPPARHPNMTNGAATISHPSSARQPSPAARFDSSTVERSAKNGPSDVYQHNALNEHAWAVERKRAGAKIVVVKNDRMGQNDKELTVRQGQLIEILDNSKKWWRARNFHGDLGHVPHNIVEEVDPEKRTPKAPPSHSSALLQRPSSVPPQGLQDPRRHHHQQSPTRYPQQLIRSPSNGNNFIMQSNNGTSTKQPISADRYHQPASHLPPHLSSAVAAPPPPPPPISSIPLPPPMPAQLMSPGSSPWSTLQLPSSGRKDRGRVHDDSLLQRVDELQQELAVRINDRAGVINQHSTKEEVQRWLTSKQISPELVQNLRHCNGEQLFQLPKSTFDRLANEAESNRLNSLLIQQKQLSGYKPAFALEKSPSSHNGAFGSLRAGKTDHSKENVTPRNNDSLSRSLKIKLQQRRDKIDESETTPRTVL